MSTLEMTRPSAPEHETRGGVESVTRRDVEGLPPPVARYLRQAIPPGLQPPVSVRLDQTGQILVGRRWRPFTATHEMTPPPAHFVWRARIGVAPLLTVHVRDSYDLGVGSMQATLAGLITVADQRGGSRLNAGALHRYLAECVWLPTALLPRYAVVWSPGDQTHATATLDDGGNRVSLEFTFNDAGEVVEVFTPARARAVKGGFDSTPWRVRMVRYGERAGMWVPTEAEVAWEIGGRWEPCWRGQITGGEAASRPP